MGAFALQLQEFAEKTAEKADAAVGNIVIRVAARLDLRSPVGDATYWKNKPPKGYVGGRFRGSWNLGVDAMPANVESIDPSGRASQGRILAAIPEKASGRLYTLLNATDYGMAIERGHSRQAPQGVVGLTVIEFQQIVNDAVEALPA